VPITHIITGLGIGGAERALHSLLTGGLEGPFHNHVVSLMGPGHYGPLLERFGVPVTCLGMRPGAAASLSAFWSLRAAIRAHRPKLIQGWMAHGNLSASFARSLLLPRAAVTWNIRSTLEGLSKAKVSTRAIIGLGASLSADPDAVIYNSCRSRIQHAIKGYVDKSSYYFPNGFDTKRWQPNSAVRATVRAELGLSEADCVIGFVGRGHPAKDPANLFKAFAQSAEKTSPRPILVAAGRNLDQFGPVPHGVILTGERQDVPRLMQSFDIFCLSSRQEGFPNVLGEAMATAVPCVTTDVGDAAAIVGGTGWVVPSRDSDALSQALLQAIETPRAALRARGIAARARIEAEFSISSAVANYIGLYAKLIEKCN
jgi:glycosyltransferase involved in cell wall biosynthesis